MKNKTIITAIITLILLQFFVLISCTQQQNKDDKPDTTRVAKEISFDTNSPEKVGQIMVQIALKSFQMTLLMIILKIKRNIKSKK